MQKNEIQHNERNLNWKQGLAIASGVPLLVLPSIGYFANYVGSFAIILWIISVLQGFIQNMAYAELATMFPKSSGLPGFAQTIFGGGSKENKLAKFLGGFSAWSYWFAWSPVLAIFSLLIGSYLHGLIPALGEISEIGLSLTTGITIFVLLFLINYKGLSGSAMVGYILAVVALVPLIVIALAPFITGNFDYHNITTNWLPDTWSWDVSHLLIIFGLLAMAQWSACAWETAAIYAPQYIDPKSDVTKAVFGCGFICLVTFSLVQLSCTGVLGVSGIIADPYSPMVLVAEKSMGSYGKFASICMLIAAMILIIQTAFLGSSRALFSLAQEGNAPKLFSKVNVHGMPVVAMVTVAIFNICLIGLKTPAAIVAASSVGYVFANGISLFAFVKARTTQDFKNIERPFKAPRIWTWIAFLFGLLNLPVYLIGMLYLNSLDLGGRSTIVGFLVLAFYIPLWLYSTKSSVNNISRHDATL